MTKTKQRFLHPALEAIDTEKRALRKVLQAVADVPPDVARAMLLRALASLPVESVGGGSVNATGLAGFGLVNDRSGGVPV